MPISELDELLASYSSATASVSHRLPYSAGITYRPPDDTPCYSQGSDSMACRLTIVNLEEGEMRGYPPGLIALRSIALLHFLSVFMNLHLLHDIVGAQWNGVQ